MTTASRISTILAGALTVALAMVGATSVGATAADGDRLDSSRVGSRTAGPAPLLPLERATPDRKISRVTLKWNGGWKKPRYQRSVVVPGIGHLDLVCKPKQTMVRLVANDRNAETQMWMAKYEVKNRQNVVAVKTARIYRYAHAFDNGKGGTGVAAHEGLNQRSPVENYSSGYLDGIISQRPGRNQPAAGAALAPVTSLRLNWYWNGFHHPKQYRFCQIDAVLKTTFPTRLGVTWHGETDAVDNMLQVTRLPSLGYLYLRCGVNDDGAGGIQSVSLVPDSKNARVYAETVTGEGRVEDHVDPTNRDLDPETGKLGPLALPRNGMMRIFFTVNGTTRTFIVSSYYVTNNGRPALNLCELSVAAY